MREVPVGREGLVALVDDADYDLISQYTWRAKRVLDTLYARGDWEEDGRRRQPYMHNLIMGAVGIDHIDHDGLNNQRTNLRPASHAQNQMNARKQRGKSSQFKGVCWDRSHQRWLARIKVDRRLVYLGYFVDEIEAARAYDAAALTHFGEFACLNFPIVEEAVA